MIEFSFLHFYAFILVFFYLYIMRFYPIIFCFCSYIYFDCSFKIPIPPPQPQLGLFGNTESVKNVLSLKTNFQLLLVILSLITLLCLVWLKLCSEVHYVLFSTNLNLHSKQKILRSPCYMLWFSANLLILLLADSEMYQISSLLIILTPSLTIMPTRILKYKKTLSKYFFGAHVISIFAIATTATSHIICIVVFQVATLTFAKTMPTWLQIFLILMSNDIELNPGPGYVNNFFTFMAWNLNSLATNDFNRVQLIEAHNSIYSYDLISICETSLTDSLVSNVPSLEGYTFEPANHPDNVTHGGVGIFYKNSLPVIVRRD